MNNRVLMLIIISALLLLIPGILNAQEPEAGKPEAGKTEAAKPEAGKTEAAKPEAGKTEAAKPEAGKTEAAKSEAGKTEAAETEAAETEAAETEIAAPVSDESSSDAGAADQPAETGSEYYEDDEVIIEGLDDVGSASDDAYVLEEEAIRNTVAIGPVTLDGVLKERGTRSLIANLTVYIKDTEFEAVSDKNGYFSFPGLPPGDYKIVIPSMDYETFDTEEKVIEGKLTTVTYYLDPKSYGTLEVIVRGQKEKKEVSRKVLTKEEIMLVPGTNGDAVRVVESLPGVARGGTSAAGAVVRGSNAEDSRISLDGHIIPMLFHFGGLKSVYNSELLKEVNLITGGFNSSYGDATGGVVDLKSRAPRDDRWGGYVDLSALDASAMAEGPVAENMGMYFALRRSTVDLILPLVLSGVDEVSFSTYPVYYDYQTKWDYKLDKNHHFTVSVYGAVDQLKLTTDTVGDENPELSGGILYDQMFHSAILHYIYKEGDITSNFSPGYNYQMLNIEIGDKYFMNWDIHLIDLHEDVKIKVAPNQYINFGAQMQPRIYIGETNLRRPPKEGDVAVSFTNAEAHADTVSNSDLLGGAYLSGEITMGPVLFIPGLRVDYESALDILSVTPKAALRINATDDLIIKLAGGLYSRSPDFDEYVEPYGNKGLVHEKATHTVFGFEYTPVQGLMIDVQGYYKYLYDMVNAVSKTDPDNIDQVYDNSAKGRSYGGELFLKYSYEDVFFGWISYGITRSERNDGPGTPYRLFDVDQTHNLVVVASWQFAKGWRLGGRFQFTSGEPYTKITDSVFNADNGTYLPIYDITGKNTERMSNFHRLDLRLDKIWVFDTWMLDVYLDVQGVYYHANKVAAIENYNFKESASMETIPILPSIGIKAEF